MYTKTKEVAPELFERVNLLDHGYIEFVEHWGSDERIVEAARMSTGKGFLGWEECECDTCGGTGKVAEPVRVWDRAPGEITVSDSWSNLNITAGICHTEMRDIPCLTCNGKGRLRGDQALLKFLWSNKHATPFEFAGATFTIQAPIMVFREWHRHRTQCSHPSTLVHFDCPKSTEKRRFVQKQTIAELWRKWQPKKYHRRQTSSCYTRERIHNMQLRMLDESSHEVEHTRIMSVIRGEPKPMVEVIVESGKKITTSLDHRFFTDQGWLTLSQALDNRARLSVETTLCGKPKSWEVKHDWNSEIWKPVRGLIGQYEVSSEGRVRCIGDLMPEIHPQYIQDYPCFHLPGIGWKCVHILVLEAFVGSAAIGQEVRHLNGNRADCRLKNLAWGTSKENAQDRIDSDRQQRLRSGFERITSARSVGLQDSYDLEVEGPYHNFVADGFVIHNSYNEMSARYTPLPPLDYLPTAERCMVVVGKNRQAGLARSADELTHEKALEWLELMAKYYELGEQVYQYGLGIGIPKELARLAVTVGRYSRMMASTDLRNWLAFLTLRMDSGAQYEIRMYANQVGEYIKAIFPKTWALFVEGRK